MSSPSLADMRFSVESGADAFDLAYGGNLNLETANSEITKVIVTIHGTSRTALSYAKYMEEATDLAHNDHTAVVAPQFLIEEDMAFYDLPDDTLYWARRGEGDWRAGDESLNQTGEISSFEVMDQLLLRLADRDAYPNVEEIIIAGHSGGGQFVNRYAAGGAAEDEAAPDISWRYVVSSPSMYLYMSAERVIDGTLNEFEIPSDPGSRSYNDYYYGLDNLNLYMSERGAAQLRENYSSRQITYFVGEEDNDPNDPSLATGTRPMLQGDNRLERGIIYFNHLQDELGPDILKNQDLEIVENAGHSARAIFNSSEFIDLVLSEKNDAGLTVSSHLVGDPTDNILHGGDEDNIIYGAAGDDGLFGGGGDDIIDGNRGDDTLNGGPGDDEFLLRYGKDTVTGGSGADFFKIDGRYANDGDSHTIRDLDFSEGDVIAFRYMDAGTFDNSVDPSNYLYVWNNGTKARFDSVEDILEAHAYGVMNGVLEATGAKDGDTLLTISASGQQVSVELDGLSFASLGLGGSGGGGGGSQPAPSGPQNIIGSQFDDVMLGSSGDDEFLLRYGKDTVTGGSGADFFKIDGRYANEGDSHTIRDLDFSEGDVIAFRYMDAGTFDNSVDPSNYLYVWNNGTKARFDSVEDILEAHANGVMTAADDGFGGTILSLAVGGMHVSLTLEGWDIV